jgi:uncharacterized protein (DUF1810 family)
MMAEAFDLDRFLDAQEGVFQTALAEISEGQKRSHWMWFVFPQLRGLGTSQMAHRYGLASLNEARAYLLHPVLGERLRVIVGAAQDLDGTSAVEVFGATDAMKLRSSLTIFIEAGGGPSFRAVLNRWFEGKADPATIALIKRVPSPI